MTVFGQRSYAFVCDRTLALCCTFHFLNIEFLGQIVSDDLALWHGASVWPNDFITEMKLLSIKRYQAARQIADRFRRHRLMV